MNIEQKEGIKTMLYGLGLFLFCILIGAPKSSIIGAVLFFYGLYQIIKFSLTKKDNQEMSICPHCGSKNDKDSSYCEQCGKQLKDLSK